MKTPCESGTEIDADRMAEWTSNFSGYRHAVTEHRIDRWLKQFDESHRDIAARILDCVDYIPQEQISASFRSLLLSLPGWNIDKSLRQGEWRFVGFTTSAGKSGDTMIQQFRVANGLAAPKHNELFVHMRDLLRENLSPNDNVVFVDDFAGTGNQVCETWAAEVAELLPGSPNTYLVLVAASSIARQSISDATGLTVTPSFELTESDNLFSDACAHFTAEEKTTMLDYCNRADRKSPKGFKECGFVIVFSHRCPNNSIPILHADHPRWRGLFRRYN